MPIHPYQGVQAGAMFRNGRASERSVDKLNAMPLSSLLLYQRRRASILPPLRTLQRSAVRHAGFARFVAYNSYSVRMFVPWSEGIALSDEVKRGTRIQDAPSILKPPLCRGAGRTGARSMAGRCWRMVLPAAELSEP